MQPIDTHRQAVDLAADLLARIAAGQAAGDDPTQALLGLVRDRLRATEPGARVLADLEREPTSDQARQAATAALSAAASFDPQLAGQLSHHVATARWRGQQDLPTAVAGSPVPPATSPPLSGSPAGPASPAGGPPGHPAPPGTAPGYPTPPGYPPAPGYPATAAAPRKSNTGLVVGIVLAVALLAICGGVVAVIALVNLAQQDESNPPAAQGTEGLVDYRETRPDLLTAQHRPGPIEYEITPPMGGDHNDRWQNCQGDVYDAPVADEHAVHSLEHGAVWITYQPSLPADQVDLLAARVRGSDYLFLSPYPGLDMPISLQAWGLQLKVSDAGDERIDDFIRSYRITAAPEAGATCGGGVTTTGPIAPPQGQAATNECVWLPEDPAGNPYLLGVGTPEPGEPRQGEATLAITTNHGVIEVRMDTAAVPCTAASFAHLGATDFYAGSSCHRLVDEGIFVLQCGDPSGTGMGGPTYRYPEENLPVGQSPSYPRGVLAMAKTAQPASTGSQFFIVYEDSHISPDYTLVGEVTQGLDIVEQVAADGHDGAYAESAGGGRPNTEVIIEAVSVTGPA